MRVFLLVGVDHLYFLYSVAKKGLFLVNLRVGPVKHTQQANGFEFSVDSFLA